MSASREKKIRQELAAKGVTDPKVLREAEEKEKQRRSNRLYGLIAVLFVVVAAALVLWNANIIQRGSTAVTIDGVKHSAAEVDYYYHQALNNLNSSQYASYLGLSNTTNVKTTNLSDTAKMLLGVEEDMTWDAYFKDSAVKNLTQVDKLCQAAAEENFTFTDEMQADLDENLEQLRTSASSAGYSTKAYIKALYGSLMNENTLKATLKNALLASHYDQAHLDSLTYTDEEIDTYYESHRNDVDHVSYEAITFTGTAPSATEEDLEEHDHDHEGEEDEAQAQAEAEAANAAARAAAKTAADAAVKRLAAGDKLEDIAKNSDIATYNTYDSASYTDGTLGNWLFDAKRQDGDSELLDTDPNYTLVLFHSRGRDEYKPVNVRHILFLADSSSLDSESETYAEDLKKLQEEAKTKAEDTLQQWKDGEATEDSFAALATELTEDTGSQSTGGLYEHIYKGQMVTAFNDWCFDASRKTGDTGIVETEYGYHVMYFVGADERSYWQQQVADTLRSEAYNGWSEELVANVTTTDGSGLKYVGQ